MGDCLDAIEAILARLSRNVVQLLRPGLPGKHIESQLAARRLPVDPDLRTLYEWRNGTDATTGLALDDLHLVPGFYLLSIDDALANYDEFIKSARWNSSWLPVLANGGGDFLALDLSNGGAKAPVRHFRIEQDDHPIEYESLAEMVATFTAAYERGVFYVDGQGFLEMDDDAYATLAATLNPKVPWWNE
jgi:hypothetical protein